MQENMFYITKTEIDEIQVDELDIENQEKLGFTYNDDYDNDVIKIQSGSLLYDNEPIEIEKVLEILFLFKNKGANYVIIDYNEDHIGYRFKAVKTNVSTKEEIEEYEK